MDGTPHRYKDVCDKALEIKKEYNLTDTQTLLYNHICRKDFYLYNSDGQKLYYPENNGFGWGGDRNWVKKQLDVLVKAGLVKFESQESSRDKRYRIWHWYDADAILEDLVSASCYMTTWRYFCIKKYLNLPDGFERNGTYGDLKLIYNKTQKDEWVSHNYTFEYKGRKNQWSFDKSLPSGNRYKISWFADEENKGYVIRVSNFTNLIHYLFEHICFFDNVVFDDKYILDATTKRLFTIEDHFKIK